MKRVILDPWTARDEMNRQSFTAYWIDDDRAPDVLRPGPQTGIRAQGFRAVLREACRDWTRRGYVVDVHALETPEPSTAELLRRLRP